MSGWGADDAGVLVLPSGRSVRGRSLRRRRVPGDALPDFALHLSGRVPPGLPWPTRWLRWPDFALPVDRLDAQDALFEVWARTDTERVEITCTAAEAAPAPRWPA